MGSKKEENSVLHLRPRSLSKQFEAARTGRTVEAFLSSAIQISNWKQTFLKNAGDAIEKGSSEQDFEAEKQLRSRKVEPDRLKKTIQAMGTGQMIAAIQKDAKLNIRRKCEVLEI